MFHHRVAYDSIPAPGADTFLMAEHDKGINDTLHAGRRRHEFTSKKALMVGALALVATILVMDPMALDIPILGASLRKRHAQNVANDFLLNYLSRDRDLTQSRHHHHGHNRVEFKDPPDGCEATIVIVRHCEKTTVREHCSYVGYERSVYLSTQFGNGNERWPAPSYIYALDAGQRHNPKKRVYREMETVLPLAVKSNVTVDYSFDASRSDRLAQNVSALLRGGQMCGMLAVICWKHSGIPHLAHKLGCGPEQGCPADYPSYSFDQVWQIKFVYQKLRHSELKSGRIPKHDVWQVFGNVEDEGFDPLAFSKKMGDYVPGGKSRGASWLPLDVEVPEQGLPSDVDQIHNVIPNLGV